MTLVITDGNSFSIIGAARKELKRLGRSDEIDALVSEMIAGDYDHLLRTVIKWFPDAITATEDNDDDDDDDMCGNCCTAYGDTDNLRSITETGWCKDCCYLDDTEDDGDE